ncbi:MAG: Ig-like domain-containing protein [Myxococcales bacterium]
MPRRECVRGWSARELRSIDCGAGAFDTARTSLNRTSNLATNTGFTATVSTGAKDLAGNALAAPYSWSFVTGTTTSTSA